MHHTHRLVRLKPMVIMLSSAYALFGLLAGAPCASAATGTNPAGTTISSVTLSGAASPAYANGDNYINNGGISTVNGYGIQATGGISLGTIGNTGTISSGGYWAGISVENATVATINNSGAVSGLVGAIFRGNVSPTRVDVFTNSGTIVSNQNAEAVKIIGATVTSLTNTGTIAGAYGIYLGSVPGTIATLSLLNNSGLIQGTTAAVNILGAGGTLASLVNSGIIAGDVNASGSNLLIANNSTLQGTLTGVGGAVGNLVATAVTFASGRQLLDDNVNTSTIQNTGATLLVNRAVTVDASYRQYAGATLQANDTVSITGNYRQASGSSLLIGVSDTAVATGSLANDHGYGRLMVSGTASIAAGASVGLVRSGSSYSFASGQRYVVVSAASGSNFNESALNYSATGYAGTLTGSTIASGGSSSLVVSLDGTGRTNPGPTTHNAIASLDGLGNYAGVSGGLLDLYNASLAIATTGEANRVGEQLAPTQSTNAGSAASGATLDVLSVVGQHADSVRLADAGGGSGVSTGDSYADWQAWGQVFGGKASQGMIDNVSGYNANYNGVVAGADRMFGDKWRAGGAFSYSGTWVSGTDNVSGNTSHVFSWGLVGYASYYGNPWYLNLSASVNRQNYHSNRLVSFSGYSDMASADFHGDQYVIKSELGYPLAGPWGSTVTPLGALSYSYQKLDSYTESAANGAALKVGAAHAEAVRSSLGGKLDKSWTTRWGNLTPTAQLMWSHQFNKSRMAVTSSYAVDSTGDTSFTTLGATPVQDTLDLSLGATLLRANNLSLTLRYDRQDGTHYHAQTLSLKARKQF